MSAVLVLLVNLLTGWISGRYPLGDYTRNVNDMWNQFIPFHLQFRDVVLGESTGSLLFNWSSGGGMPFWGDYATYLSSPFAFLVVLFPRSEIELAMWVIVSLKMAAAAACMAWFLGSLRTGPRWVLALLGASYGLCGWAMDDASYVPMWLDGLIALPVLALVALWALERRRFVAGVALIAVAWWANFYTAYMASLGAATVLVAMILIRRQSLKEGLTSVGRFAVQGVLGVGITAVLLVPTFIATQGATPGVSTNLRPVPWGVLAERLLSGTEGVGRSPSLAVGTFALVLALALPWLSALERRTRVVLTVGALLVAVSLNLKYTHLAWHLFSSPNGSQFRQAFIVCFWLVLLAWFAAGVRWTRTAVAGAGASLAVVGVVAMLGTSGFTTTWTWLTLGGAFVGLAAVYLWLQFGPRTGNAGQILPRAGAVVAALALVVDLTGTFLITQTGQDVFLSRPPTASAQAEMEAVPEPTGDPLWPERRSIPLTAGNLNAGMLLGVQGLEYYSSLTPRPVSDAIKRLGWPYLADGRSFRVPDDSVSWAGMGVGVVVGNGQEFPQPSLPMVRVLDAAPGVEGTVWANREAMLGREIYTPAEAEISVGGEAFEPLVGERELDGGADVRIRTSCTATREVLQLLVSATNPVQVSDAAGGTVRTLTGETTFQATGGTDVDLTLSPSGPFDLPDPAVRCVSVRAIEQAAAAATSADSVRIHGAGIDARFETPATGFITVATFAQPGWSCDTGQGPAPIVAETGLLSVAADGTSELSCTFTPPGLVQGIAITVVSLVAFAALGVLGLILRRRRAPSPDPAA